MCYNIVHQYSFYLHFLVYDEFEQLLHDSVSIELFVEWLDKIIDEIIVKVMPHTYYIMYYKQMLELYSTSTTTIHMLTRAYAFYGLIYKKVLFPVCTNINDFFI